MNTKQDNNSIDNNSTNSNSVNNSSKKSFFNTQGERLDFLVTELSKESSYTEKLTLPEDMQSKKDLLRYFMNIRLPMQDIDNKILKVQDEYLQEEIKNNGIVKLGTLAPVNRSTENNIYLWLGDITRLEVDAIVNAANSKMLGCFIPGHKCIDNAIHTFAGMQLRLECNKIMKKQGFDEPTGSAKITSGYNLPCKYILHTVGPIIHSELTENDCNLLENCYTSCLELATRNNLESIAFCCISTGEFHFPNDIAAKIAVDTVKKFQKEKNRNLKVIFNVFKDLDYKIYENLLK